MGAIQVEVKVLRGKKPVLVTWENPAMNVVESLLVTCPCQGLHLEIPSVQAKGRTVYTKRASNLAHALEVADVVTCASVDHLISLADHLHLSDETREVTSTDGRQPRPKQKKSKLHKTSKRGKVKKRKFSKSSDVLVKTDNSSSLDHPASALGLDTERKTKADKFEKQEIDSLEEEIPHPGSATASGLPDDCRDDNNVVVDADSIQMEEVVNNIVVDADSIQGEKLVNNIVVDADSIQREELVNDIVVDADSIQREELVNNIVVDADSIQREELESNIVVDADRIQRDELVNNIVVDADSIQREELVNDIVVDADSIQREELVNNIVVDADSIQREELVNNNGANECLEQSNLEAENAGREQTLLSDTSKRIHGTMDTFIDISNVENVVIPASSTSSDSTEAVMKVLGGILASQSETGIPESDLTPRVCDLSIGRSSKAKVKVIKNLTEEERKEKFLFWSDNEKKNRYELEHNGTKAYLCEYCGKVLSQGTRKRHLQTHTSDRERNNVCEVCGKRFYSREGLRHHGETHDAKRTFNCRYCDMQYKTMYGRTLHERKHFAIHVEKCGKCGEHFKNLDDLKTHAKAIHNGDHVVDVPTAVKPSRRGRHSEVLKEGQPGTSTCEICLKVVLDKSLRAHLSRHKNQMFTCQLCGKVMANMSRYSHMKLHTGQKDHKCDFCGKCFASKTTLTVHVRTHTGERPIKCRHCDRGFTRHYSREVHEASHTNERPFKCTICDKSWKDRSSYGTHMKKNHPGEPLVYKRLSAQINSQQGKLSTRLEIINGN
ncbi:uncharacterized protein [Apostichopus japonicus]|uniref:uncharacterized protein n=1 Tax=Stichopus japonicus TaxID=307972 RepID=UPI003AB2826B